MALNGKGKVFIRAYSNTAINGVNYQKDDVICYFNNVDFSVGYSLDNNVSNIGAQILMSHSEKHANRISIVVEGIKNGVWKLIGKKITSNSFYKPIAVKISSDSNGSSFLPTSSNISGLEVYLNGEKEVGFLDNGDGYITNLTPDSDFIAMYYEETTSTLSHTISKEGIPYLYIEFIQENQEGSIYIKVPKVSLVTTPNLNFNQESLVNIPLEFLIIDSEIEIYGY